MLNGLGGVPSMRDRKIMGERDSGGERKRESTYIARQGIMKIFSPNIRNNAHFWKKFKTRSL